MPCWITEKRGDSYIVEDEDGQLIWAAETQGEIEAVIAAQQQQLDEERGAKQVYYKFSFLLPHEETKP